MGIRGELFSTKLILPNRTYFLNVKENRLGDLYLNIVESKNKETGGFDRQSVIVFADDLPAFLGEFDKSLKVLERAAREQKRNPPDRGKRRDSEPDGGDRNGRGSGEKTAAGRSGPDAKRNGPDGRRSGPNAGRGGPDAKRGGKRMVVKKRDGDE
ncbi:MAG: DUF3276 family protein [Treponema sp.]|jgi:hypothetical protein|nr:DUF3276 family protein [Treponema sp.]